MDRLDAILARLSSYYPKAIAPGLERTHHLLEKCGNPHLKLPPVIHIAGTNGKGSTLAFLRAIAQSHGLTVHAMTSPHLVRFNERLVVSGFEISDDDLYDLLTRVEKINAQDDITFFEITTVAGFLAFAETPADIVLLETGMGGTWDSTNVVPDPIVTTITMISYDHMHYLGDTLAKIAGEKAGIMKRAVPCVIGAQTDDGIAGGVMDVFRDRAHDVGCDLVAHDHAWNITVGDDGFDVVIDAKKYFFPHPSLAGAHQIKNAATAIVTWDQFCKARGLNFDVTKIADGIQNTHWPARLQRLTKGPLVDLLPDGFTLTIDGAHNDTGGQVVGAHLNHTSKAHIICGMLTTKKPHDFFAPIKPHALSVSTVTIPDEKLSLTAQELAAQIGGTAYDDLEAAIKNIVAHHPPAPILICGSLYLAGFVLRENG
jgi:dihydrofolate synthase / folylpolyglutamate synthase